MYSIPEGVRILFLELQFFMILFLIQNIRWLFVGFLLTFASTGGQTWFISLCSPSIKEQFNLSDGGWGGIYTLATLASAVIMFWQGSIVDRVPTRIVTLVTACLFTLAAIGMACGQSTWILGGSLFLLRFCGQGMFGHIAMTTLGRWFVNHRGRAVALANLGYPASEILFAAPAIIVIQTFGWQALWLCVASFLILIFMPLTAVLLRTNRVPAQRTEHDVLSGLQGRHWVRKEALRHWLLPALLPTLLTPGLMGTVLFFNQTHLAEIKQWDLVAMSPGFTCFALSGVMASFWAGWAVDRFGGYRLIPFLLLPIGFGMALISQATSVTAWYIALGSMGVTMGMSSALWGAVLPALYGTQHLGSIRSLTTTIMVFSTAIGPGLTGLLIDSGVDFTAQCVGFSVWCFVIAIGSYFVEQKLAREMTESFHHNT